MTEPSRKKQKGRAAPTLTVVNKQVGVEVGSTDELRWWTAHEHRPGEFNLIDFETGVSEKEAERRRLRSPFSGRPVLIRELAPYIKVFHQAAPKATTERMTASLRAWWRLFDSCGSIAPVTCLSDLNDIHNAEYLRSGKRIEEWKAFMAIVRVARQELNLPILYWTAPERVTKIKNLVDQSDVSRIYHRLKRLAFNSLQRYDSDPQCLPTKREMQHFFLIYLLRTGWNPQTALDIDVTLDRSGNLSCIRPHPTSPNHHIVRSIKDRANGVEQYALGANKPQLSCGNIILKLNSQSASLRAKLRIELEITKTTMRSEHYLTKQETEKIEVNIKYLEAMIRSPWLFSSNHVRGRNLDSPIGDISFLTSGSYQDAGSLGIMKGLIQDVNNRLTDGQKKISNIVVTDLRDAYIEAQYERSGYSWITAMLAAQHSSIETARAYLNKRQYKARSEKRFLAVTNEVWFNVIDRRAVDPTRIAGKLAGASDEQIVRWQEGKDRTRVGMGCTDFHHPPRSVAPEHTTGTGCRVQRCMLCEQGIVFTDSVSHLARRRAELHHLERHIPFVSWHESRFPEEVDKVDKVLQECFESNEAEKWLSHWKKEIEEKRHIPLSMEGSYA